MREKKERNFWPYGIVGMILSVVVFGIYAVNEAIHHPVQESTYMMRKYQNVEENAYELEKQKDMFDKNFKILYSISKFKIGKNEFSLKIIDKNTNKPISHAKIDLLLTRPETNDLNVKLKPVKVQTGNYIFTPFEIKKLGRWKVLTDIKIDNYEGFNSYDINATRK